MAIANRTGAPGFPGEGDMAQIVKFPSETRTPSSPDLPRTGSAQILFFTGVRYERAALTQAKAPRRPRRRRPQPGTKSA